MTIVLILKRVASSMLANNDMKFILRRLAKELDVKLSEASLINAHETLMKMSQDTQHLSKKDMKWLYEIKTMAGDYEKAMTLTQRQYKKYLNTEAHLYVCDNCLIGYFSQIGSQFR
jgi:hypothetical protein